MLSLTSVLVAVVLLEIGSGLQGLLLPVRAELAGFSPPGIGLLGGAYYLGFVAGCIWFPATVRRVGHIRSYAAVAVLATVAILAHPLTPPASWYALRLLLGFSIASLFMVIESWMNGATEKDRRGRTLGLYMVATWAGLIGGKALFPATPFDGFQPFTLSAAAVALSVIPITLTRVAPPTIAARTSPARQLAGIAPLGIAGCFGTGLANGAFWTFGPVYAFSTDGDPVTVSLFMIACIAGGALSQWPVGRLSDAFDRRWSLVGLCAAACAAGALMVFGTQPLLLKGALFGAVALPAYSLFVAHANDRAEPDAYVDMSSLLLLAFGIGALIGPPLAGLVTGRFGSASLFAWIGAVHAGLVVITCLALLRSSGVPRDERAAFAAHPPIGHGTQAAAGLQAAQAADPAAAPRG